MTLTSPDIKPGGKIADEQVFDRSDCTPTPRPPSASTCMRTLWPRRRSTGLSMRVDRSGNFAGGEAAINNGVTFESGEARR
jgi:hypothetical protein